MNWKIKDLKEELKNQQKSKAIRDWAFSERELSRREFYLIQEKSENKFGVGLDQDRTVNDNSIFVDVTVDTDLGKQGRASKQFYPSKDLKSQVTAVINSASLVSEEYWELPTPSKKAKVKPEICYQGIKKDLDKTAEALLEDMNHAIAGTEDCEFNSSEIFVSKEASQLTTSHGFEKDGMSSEIYSEVCFSHTNANKKAEEFLLVGYNMHPEQFNYQKMCFDSAEYAKRSLEVERPETGKYSVLLHADVLNEVFHNAVSHLRSSGLYYNMPFKQQGSEFIEDFQGSEFKMSLDPSVNYLFGSCRFNSAGVAQEPIELIKNNKVVNNLTSHQMAQYLNKKPTSTLGNVVIQAKGGKSVEELRTEGAGQVLEILQFSGLFTSPLTLTFSSEIRLARLFDNRAGKVTYIKGGSLSGNLMENLKGVKWSKSTTTHNHKGYSGDGQGYFGPECALFSNVMVSA